MLLRNIKLIDDVRLNHFVAGTIWDSTELLLQRYTSISVCHILKAWAHHWLFPFLMLFVSVITYNTSHRMSHVYERLPFHM